MSLSRRDALLAVGTVGVTGFGAAGYSWLRETSSEPEAVGEARRTVAADALDVVELRARSTDVRFVVDVERGDVESWISQPSDDGSYTGVEPIGGEFVDGSGSVRYELPSRDVRLVFKNVGDGGAELVYRLEWF